MESSTVQSHYALQTADMVAERVVARSTSPLCRKDESGQHYIIWDEAWMSANTYFSK